MRFREICLWWNLSSEEWIWDMGWHVFYPVAWQEIGRLHYRKEETVVDVPFKEHDEWIVNLSSHVIRKKSRMNELSDRITINESQLRMTNIDPCTNYLKGAESMEEGTLREGFSWSEKVRMERGFIGVKEQWPKKRRGIWWVIIIPMSDTFSIFVHDSIEEWGVFLWGGKWYGR